MLTTIKLIRNSYYKLRIILTFCIVTIALVILMSRLSYVFIRNIYLAQMKEQVKNLTTAMSKQIDSTSLNMLEYGLPTKTTSGYFSELFKKNLSEDNTNSAFLFDDKFKVFIHSDQSVRAGKEETHLFLYRDEIFGIKPGFNSVTLPFKGDDGQWYLLGFYRLNENFWFAIKESAQRLEKVEDFSKIFWFIGFGGTLLTIIMGWLLSRSITKPIDKLVSFSHQIGEGNFVNAVPKNLKGEIVMLQGKRYFYEKKYC